MLFKEYFAVEKKALNDGWWEEDKYRLKENYSTNTQIYSPAFDRHTKLRI